jgi:putative peptidoglycan lipid II flippase
MAFLQFLPEGGWSAVVLTNRLIQLPIGVLQTALLVPLFPRMVNLVDEKRFSELDTAVVTGVGGLWFITLPLMVLFIFFSQPLITVVFQHGNFDASDVQIVTLALLYQSFQMIPYFARDTLTRVFYAFGDTRTPLLVGLLAIGFKALFNWLFIVQWMHLGVGGLTLSVTLITAVNWLLLSVLLKRGCYPSLPTSGLLLVLLKLLIAVLPMAAVGYLVHQPWALPLVSWLPKTSVSGGLSTPLLQLLSTVLFGLPAYWWMSHTLKVPGIEAVQQKVLAKFFKK